MAISASLIVKDCARTLDACLASVRPHVDEIVVCDTGSRDETREIAARYADVSFDSALFNAATPLYEFHFGAARNEALERCTGDWVFSIDADEVCHIAELADYLRTAALCVHAVWLDDVANAPPEISAKLLRVQLPRLFPRDGRHTWRLRCHEVPHPSPEDAPIVPYDVCHLQHLDNSERSGSLRRNLLLLKRQLAETHTDELAAAHMKTLLDLSATYYGLGGYCESVGYADVAARALRVSNKPKLRAYALFRAALAYFSAGLLRDAADAAFDSLRLQPYGCTRVLLISSLVNLGRFDEAQRQARTALANIGEEAMRCMVDDAQGRHKWLERALERCMPKASS